MRTNLTGALVGLLSLALAGCPQKQTPPPEVPNAPVIHLFEASPQQVAKEEGATLSWRVEHATSVSILHLGQGPVDGVDPAAAEGSVTVHPSEDAVFVLTARGPGGTDSLAAGVRVQGDEQTEILFAAFPQEISAGESTTLAWTAPGATAVTLTGPAGAPVDLGGQVSAGSVEVLPEQTAEYTLDVDGETRTLTVTVRPAILDFVADRGAVVQEQEVTLSWRTGGADALTLSRAGAGVLYTAPSPGAVAEGSFVDTVPPAIPDDGVLRYELAISRGDVTVKKTLPVYVGVTPKATFTAPLAVLANAGFVVNWTSEQADSVELLVEGEKVYQATTAAQVRQGQFVLGAPANPIIEVALRLTNKRGGELTLTREVEVIGPVTFVSFGAAPTVAAQGGEPVTLSWNVTNARFARVMVGTREVARVTGKDAETGTAVVYPNGPTTYRLEADNTVGSAIPPAEVDVTVTTPAKVLWDPSPTVVGASIIAQGHTVVGGGQLQGLPSIVKNEPGTAFVDIAETGVPATFSSGTTAVSLFTLPETFHTMLYGVRVSSPTIALNKLGFFVFAESTKTAGTTNTAFPNTLLHPLAVSPYWKHQIFDATNNDSAILVQVDGPAHNRRLIVQWNKMEQSGVPGSELTYQAQVYADGTVVFAYKTLQGLTAPDASVGVVNRDESEVLFPADMPLEGDRYTFFGVMPQSFAWTAKPEDYLVSVPVGTPLGSQRMELEARPEILPARGVYFSEVNYHPVAAAPEGEWFELTQADNMPLDLDGWVLDFGGGQQHTITGPLTFPASGVLLFGQSNDVTQNGGVTLDYVYGPSFTLSDTSGTLRLLRHGAEYATVSWTAGVTGGEGVSLRADPPNPDLLYAPGITQLTCGSGGTYGPLDQVGTPGQRDARCFPYELEFGAVGDFEPLAGIGQPLTITNLSEDIMVLGPTSSPALTHPVKWGYGTYDTLYVSTNAWIAPRNASDPAITCPASNDCYKGQKNRTTFDPATMLNRVLALYWSDTNVQSGGGIYVLRKDPDPNVAGDEYTIVSFENMRWASTGTAYDLNWQVKFYDNGDIEYHFGTMYAALNCTTNCGSSSTTWMESEDGNAALVVNISSSSNPGIRPDTVWRFKFTP